MLINCPCVAVGFKFTHEASILSFVDIQSYQLKRNKRRVKNATEVQNKVDTMIKINKLLTEGKLQLCRSKVVTCAQGPSGPALLVHLDPKEPRDGEDTKEGLETKEIKALWDNQERAGSKALWGLKA